MLTRRELCVASGLAAVGLVLPRRSPAADVVEIRMRSDADGTEGWFDPVGVHIQPGQTVRWVVAENVDITTAYAPANDMHLWS